jgi:predicted O-linked N-acetylglucosamine transferase (SPINDLY family)
LANVQALTIADLFSETDRLTREQQPQKAADLYKTWIARNGSNQLLHAVYFNYAVALSRIGDSAGAINVLRECIRMKPDFYPPYINLGRALEDTGQVGTAVSEWLALVNNLAMVNGDSVKHKLMVLQQLGRVLEGAHSDGPAEDALKKALEINPAQGEVVQHYVSLRQRQCKWPAIEETEHITAKALMRHISPLSLANHADDPIFQLGRAYRYGRDSIGIPGVPYRHDPKSAHKRGKLRIGYVSSDLREHAVGFGMTDVLETHDRSKFEIFAYYCGIKRTDATQARAQAAVDLWFDINGLSNDQAAMKIADDKIDILVDLNGYTKDARTKVFALRPAPINANWFGYPGTMGTPYHHYIIADEYIIPENHEIYYTEKVLRLPCYQPNDRKRVVATERPSRAQEGLPEDAFIFCCLNGMQKITPEMFKAWMTILKGTENSVLWLLGNTDDTKARIKKLTEQAGVSPDRIIYAAKKPNPHHLARYPLADLFLDTFPYGAHTTAADAMWMGVPLLTISGRGFASRVCGSLVRAAGIPEMICPTLESYIERAIGFAKDGENLKATRRRLEAGRDGCVLFDTPTLTRNLESLYRGMWEDYQAGALPVPDLTNLDVYCDTGVQLNLEHVGALPDEQYRARYQERLSLQHQTYPIPQDERIWRAS